MHKHIPSLPTHCCIHQVKGCGRYIGGARPLRSHSPRVTSPPNHIVKGCGRCTGGARPSRPHSPRVTSIPTQTTLAGFAAWSLGGSAKAIAARVIVSASERAKATATTVMCECE